jgi:hypothetical protein
MMSIETSSVEHNSEDGLKKLANIEQYFSKAPECPVTGRLVMEKVDVFSLPKEPIIWWRCPICQGWHVMKIKAASHLSLA